MAKRTIRHALFRFTDEEGHTQVALRGSTVDVPEKEAKRGDELGAFTKEAGQEPDRPGTVAILTPDATDEEYIAWVKAAKVDEVSEYLSEHPGEAARILDAETQARDGKPRAGVEKAAETAAGSNA